MVRGNEVSVQADGRRCRFGTFELLEGDESNFTSMKRLRHTTQPTQTPKHPQCPQ